LLTLVCQITFPGEGDDLDPSSPPQDIVFLVEQRPHELFTRDGDDLVATLKIELWEALCGFSREITTLDGRKLRVSQNDPIEPGREIMMRGEGMPVSKVPGKKGNLKVKINVNWPRAIPSTKKDEIKKVLGNL
jgi:DnaJ family protein B protein 4